MIRDRRKDEAYFEIYIDDQIERIRKKTDKLLSCGDKETGKRARINLSLIHYKMDLLAATYSLGGNRSQLTEQLSSAIETLCELEMSDYETVLNILSFCVMLDCKELGKKVCGWNSSYVNSDKLLRLLSEYLSHGRIVWEGDFIIKKIYDELNEVVDKKDENALIIYLVRWYENRSEAAWYDSDKNENDVYVGYWSFESAAIARILRMNETILSRIDVYPYLEK